MFFTLLLMRYLLFFVSLRNLQAASDIPLCRPLSFLRSSWDHNEDIRVIVVGDVHGDAAGLIEVYFNCEILQAFLKLICYFIQILLHANVIIPTSTLSCDWSQTTRQTTIIQMGDIVDRGKHALQAFNCLEALQEKQSNGNSVIRLIGSTYTASNVYCCWQYL